MKQKHEYEDTLTFDGVEIEVTVRFNADAEVIRAWDEFDNSVFQTSRIDVYDITINDLPEHCIDGRFYGFIYSCVIDHCNENYSLNAYLLEEAFMNLDARTNEKNLK